MSRDLTPEFWREMATKLPAGATIIDVGAHGLEEAAQLLPRLKNASWHAFEPHPVCYRNLFTVRHELERQTNNIIYLWQRAVGDKIGPVDFYISKKTTGEAWSASSSTEKPKNVTTYHQWLDFEPPIKVDMITLDFYKTSQLLSPVHLLKMDVQGAEIRVIRGGQETLKRTKYIVTEVVENEEYEGQIGLAGLMAALPGRWGCLERLTCDALLMNLDFQD